MGAIPNHLALGQKGATHDDVLGLLPDPEGVKPQEPERLSAGAKATLAYRLIEAYARSLSDCRALFQPLPEGAASLTSRAHIQLFTGSNRSGKTTHSAYKIAQIFRGFGEHLGFPAKGGSILVVGKDWDHIADPMWKKLVWPGQFPIIRDRDTGQWRCVRLDPENAEQLDPDDQMRKGEWKPGPPFLPLEEIEIAWEKAREDKPKFIRHKKSGWEMRFHSSEGRERKGVARHIVWFDEEILREQWIAEALARLVDYDGSLIWSFTPEGSTPTAYEFHKKAQSGDPETQEFAFHIYNNPFLPAKAKQKFYDSLTPEERRVKWHGEYAITSRRVYPHFYPETEHGVANFEIPNDWMRLFAVDPGQQTCAVLYCAVPPHPDENENRQLAPHTQRWPELHFYKEDYIQGADAAKYGRAVEVSTKGSVWEVAIVDWNYAQQKFMTSGRPLAAHMEDEHKNRNIYTRLSGNGYFHGSMDVDGRTDSAKNLLNASGLVKLHRGCLPNLCREMDSEYYAKDNPDKRILRSYGHLVFCFEVVADYFISRGGVYYNRPDLIVAQPEGSPAYRKFQSKLKRVRRADRQRA